MTESSSDSNRRPTRPPLTMMQVLVLLGVVAALLIMLDFNRRLAEAQRLVDAATAAGREVAQLETEYALLQTQVAYATTDAAVIEWAHDGGKLVQPGEVIVVPVVPTPIPTPHPPPAPSPAPPPTYTLWWNLFFDIAVSPER